MDQPIKSHARFARPQVMRVRTTTLAWNWRRKRGFFLLKECTSAARKGGTLQNSARSQSYAKIAAANMPHQHAITHLQMPKRTRMPRVKQMSLHASEADIIGTTQTVLMPTVTAWNKGTKTKKVSWILFDSGSKRTFITEECSRKLGCRLLEQKL